MDFSAVRERARSELRRLRTDLYVLAVKEFRHGDPTADDEAHYWRAVAKRLRKLTPELQASGRAMARRAWADAKRARAEAKRKAPQDAEGKELDRDLWALLIMGVTSTRTITATESFIWKLSIHIEGQARKAYCVDLLNGGDGGEDKHPDKERVEKAERKVAEEEGLPLPPSAFPEKPGEGGERVAPTEVTKGGEGGEETKGKPAPGGTNVKVIHVDPDDLKKPIFFLASWHSDCAEDHEQAQGHVYLDREWRRKVKGEGLRRAVEQEVSDRDMQYFQDIIFRPTWLITRPNCRHYFRPLRTEDVIGGVSDDELLAEQGMEAPVGDREMTPIGHPTNREWYTETNVKNIIEQYRARLAYRKEMLRLDPSNTKLQEQVRKDELLLRRWQNFYRRTFGREG